LDADEGDAFELARPLDDLVCDAGERLRDRLAVASAGTCIDISLLSGLAGPG
jgi:hypothetical protein